MVGKSRLIAGFAIGLLLTGVADIAAPSGSALTGIPEGALSAGIDAQPLVQALAAFAQQSGLHLLYVSALAEHRRSRPVAAGLSPTAALTQLLRTNPGFELAYEDKVAAVFVARKDLKSGENNVATLSHRGMVHGR